MFTSIITLLLALVVANILSGLALMAIAFGIMLNPTAYRWLVSRCVKNLCDDDLLD